MNFNDIIFNYILTDKEKHNQLEKTSEEPVITEDPQETGSPILPNSFPFTKTKD